MWYLSRIYESSCHRIGVVPLKLGVKLIPILSGTRAATTSVNTPGVPLTVSFPPSLPLTALCAAAV